MERRIYKIFLEEMNLNEGRFTIKKAGGEEELAENRRSFVPRMEGEKALWS